MKNRLVKAEVEGDELVIRIGVEMLAFAAEHLEELVEEAGDRDTVAKVSDHVEFARHVARELNREGEDGTTPIHALLDEAILQAVEDGSDAIAVFADMDDDFDDED